MLAPTSAAYAGKRLRAARESLCLSIREVEDLSREISLKLNTPDFFISRTWLGALEAGKLKLNIGRPPAGACRRCKGREIHDANA